MLIHFLTYKILKNRSPNFNKTVLRKIILIILISHCTINAVQAQWIQQNSGVSGNLYDVKFINRFTGWACGDDVILKTTNGGNQWILQNGIPEKLYSNICPVDSNVVFCVGWFQTIVKTTNGGINWLILQDGPKGSGHSYEDVSFINENTGWISGDLGVILKTTNGGMNFVESSLFAGYLYNIYFKDELTGITIGTGVTMFKTTSSGLNWQNISMPIGTRIPEFRKLSVINNKYAWMIAQESGRIFRTNDFGSSWEAIDTIFTNRSMYSIEFADTSIGFTGGSSGVLFKTTDGGYSWTSQNNGGDNRFWGSIHCYNDSIVWGVGGAGKIMHTTTGGATMVNLSQESEHTPYEYILFQNFPNPFNSQTKIRYDLKTRSNVVMKIYDITGKVLNVIEEGNKKPGSYEIYFDADRIPSGVLIYTLTTDEVVLTKKMILIK